MTQVIKIYIIILFQSILITQSIPYFDAEKAFSKKGKRNLRDEKSRIRGELKGGGIAKRGMGKAFRGGGLV